MKNLIDQVNYIIETEIRPQIRDHGGEIELVEIVEKIVYIKLTGNCSGCPSAQITTENIVETTLKQHLGEQIDKVVLKNEISDDLISLAKKILNKNI